MGARALGPILRDLGKQSHWFDLDRNDLAEKLMDEAVEVIAGEMDRETDPDGNSWADLSPMYARWKASVSPGNPMAVLFGLMKTTEQLSGRRFVAPTEARMVYGIDEQPIEEASNFQDPENPNQPGRRFYEFSAEALQRMDAVCDRHYQKVK